MKRCTIYNTVAGDRIICLEDIVVDLGSRRLLSRYVRGTVWTATGAYRRLDCEGRVDVVGVHPQGLARLEHFAHYSSGFPVVGVFLFPLGVTEPAPPRPPALHPLEVSVVFLPELRRRFRVEVVRESVHPAWPN